LQPPFTVGALHETPRQACVAGHGRTRRHRTPAEDAVRPSRVLLLLAGLDGIGLGFLVVVAFAFGKG